MTQHGSNNENTDVEDACKKVKLYLWNIIGGKKPLFKLTNYIYI